MSQLWQSLRIRLVAGVLCATTLAMWSVTLFISHYLRQDMEAAISAQQFSSVSLIAAEVDRSVRERINALGVASRGLAALDFHKPRKAQATIEALSPMLPLFNWGLVLVDEKGLAVASIPESLGRTGTSYGDLAFFREMLESGKTLVTEPLPGRRTGAPVLTIAEPLKDADGKFVGALLGVTNLQKPNFLDEISAAKYGQTGDFLLTAPKSRVFIASSDKRRVMKPGPRPGINPVYDRYLNGYEGSGVAVSSRGGEELSSSRRIPSTGWLLQSVLPTEEAFAPIRNMQRNLLLITLSLTVLAGGIAWWWLRHQLKPLEEASAMLDQMRDGSLERQPLPVRRNDEIGKLANAFNGLLQSIVDQQALVAEAEANRRVRKILAHVPGMVFQYQLHADGSGAFPFASEAVRKIYGVPPEALENHAGAIRAMLVSEDAERFFASMQVSAQTFQPWVVDYRIRLADNQIKWLHVDAVPELDDKGMITWYGFVADVTESKAMADELARHRDRLEELVEERTRELAAAKDAAEAANVAKSAFLANMSHEIRTPLNAITGMAYLVRRSGVTPQQEERLERIDAAGKHLLETINAILDLSKIEAGKFTLEESAISVGGMLANVASILATPAEIKGLQLNVEHFGCAHHLLGDPTRLQQALLNYATNAIKFTEAGSITLRARVTDEQDDRVTVMFEVEDTGIGIANDNVGKLFSAFEQADNSISRRYGGTGLGLAITRRLAELMGGTAGVKSQAGVGSTFWFEVPLKKAAEMPAVRVSAPILAEHDIAERYAGRPLLLVEDDEVNREVILELLADCKLNVEFAVDGVEAVEKAEAKAYDLILMDMQMPRMDGLEATRRIRQLPTHGDVPIIAMTANAFAEDKAHCFDAGMNDFIAKPLNPDALFSTVQKWLAR